MKTPAQIAAACGKVTTGTVAVVMLTVAPLAHADPVSVPNGNFEDYEAITPAALGGWQSLPGGHPDVSAATLLVNDEFWSNPSSFASGWQNNGGAGTNGRFGLQHPSDNFYQRDAAHLLQAPFNNDFIGFVNMDDVDGFQQTAQSGVIGNLGEGTYTLRVAVGARANANWNDVRYETSLVADPVPSGLGTAGGNSLGTPAALTLVPFISPLGTNVQDVVYTLALGPSDPNLGKPFAIRIDSFNTFIQNGIPDPGAPINGGTNARFTQGNFDNVRLDYLIPEPASAALLGCAVTALAVRRRRR